MIPKEMFSANRVITEASGENILQQRISRFGFPDLSMAYNRLRYPEYNCPPGRFGNDATTVTECPRLGNSLANCELVRADTMGSGGKTQLRMTDFKDGSPKFECCRFDFQPASHQNFESLPLWYRNT